MALSWRVQTMVMGMGLAVLVLLVLAVDLQPLYPVDDAYIAFRYVENWARGEGLVFNPGDRVEAYSNPLWIVLIGLLRWAGLSPPLGARLISVAALVTTCLLLFLLLRKQQAGRWFLPAVISLSFVVFPATVFHTLSGLETPLSCLLLLLGLFVLESQPTRPPWLMGVVLGLFSLTRPEGVVVFLFFFLGTILAARHDACSRSTRPGILLFSYLTVTVPLFLWRLVYYGSLLPNSVVAKSGFTDPEILKGGAADGLAFLSSYAPIVVLAAISLVLDGPRRTLFFEISVAVALGVVVLLGGAVDGYPYHRYLFPLVPFLLLRALDGLSKLAAAPRGGVGRLRNPTAAMLLSIVVLTQAGLMLALGPPLLANSLPWKERILAFFAQDSAPHSASPETVEGIGHHALAAWLKADSSPGDLLATYEIGIVPYYTSLPTLDLFGLADKRIARNSGPPGLRVDPEEVFKRAPRYFGLRVMSHCLCSGYPTFLDPRLRFEYDLVAAFQYWDTEWLLFKRRRVALHRVVDDFRSATRVGPLRSVEKLQLIGRERRKQLMRAIREAAEEPGSVQAAAMREWLGSWRSGWVLPAGPAAQEAAIRRLVSVPQGGALRLALAVNAVNDKGFGDVSASRAAVEVLVRSADGSQVVLHRQEFDSSSHPEPGWRDLEVGLEQFAGQAVEVCIRLVNPGLPLNLGIGELRLVALGEGT